MKTTFASARLPYRMRVDGHPLRVVERMPVPIATRCVASVPRDLEPHAVVTGHIVELVGLRGAPIVPAPEPAVQGEEETDGEGTDEEVPDGQKEVHRGSLLQYQ